MQSLAAPSERLACRITAMALDLAAAASFTMLHASVRCASRALYVFEITLFRYFIAPLFMLPGLLSSPGTVNFRARPASPSTRRAGPRPSPRPPVGVAENRE